MIDFFTKQWVSGTLFFFKDFIYLFLQRGEGKGRRKKERNINVWLPLAHPMLGTWPATQACALTGDQTRDPLVHSPELNPLSHSSQGSVELMTCQQACPITDLTYFICLSLCFLKYEVVIGLVRSIHYWGLGYPK